MTFEKSWFMSFSISFPFAPDLDHKFAHPLFMNEKDKKRRIYSMVEIKQCRNILMIRNSWVKVDTIEKFLDPFVTRQTTVYKKNRTQTPSL